MHKLDIAQRLTAVRHSLYREKIRSATYQLLALAGWVLFVGSQIVEIIK